MANQAIRQEINLKTFPNNNVTGTQDLFGRAQLDTTKYSGTPTYWFEAVISGVASNTGSITLRRNGTSTDDATISGDSAGITVWAIHRVQFTPPAGQTDYVVHTIADVSSHGQGIKCARIIVLQSEASITSGQTQIEVGGDGVTTYTNTAVADVTAPKFWKYNSSNWDGTKSFFVEAVWVTSASNTVTITLCRTSDNAANVTVVNAQSNTTIQRTRVSFTPVNGETYKIRSLGSTTKSNYKVYNAKIVADQSVNPTKFEPQFLLLNTTDGGTGAQNALTTYNSSEWNAGSGTITITHLVDSDNASNSAKIVTSAGADTGSSSSATGATQPESSSFTLIDATNYDTNVTNSTGTVAASRLKFVYVFVAGRRLFVTGG